MDFIVIAVPGAQSSGESKMYDTVPPSPVFGSTSCVPGMSFKLTTMLFVPVSERPNCIEVTHSLALALGADMTVVADVLDVDVAPLTNG